MIRPTSGVLTGAAYDFARARLVRSSATERAVLRTSASSSSSAAIPSSRRIVSVLGVPLRKQSTASRRTARLGSRAASSRRSGSIVVDVARVVAGERLERDQRGAAHRGTFVVQPATQELELLPEAELGQGAKRERAPAVVGVARRRLDLVAPLCPERRELGLAPLCGELVRVRGGLDEIHDQASVDSERAPGPT